MATADCDGRASLTVVVGDAADEGGDDGCPSRLDRVRREWRQTGEGRHPAARHHAVPVVT